MERDAAAPTLLAGNVRSPHPGRTWSNTWRKNQGVENDLEDAVTDPFRYPHPDVPRASRVYAARGGRSLLWHERPAATRTLGDGPYRGTTQKSDGGARDVARSFNAHPLRLLQRPGLSKQSKWVPFDPRDRLASQATPKSDSVLERKLGARLHAESAPDRGGGPSVDPNLREGPPAAVSTRPARKTKRSPDGARPIEMILRAIATYQASLGDNPGRVDRRIPQVHEGISDKDPPFTRTPPSEWKRISLALTASLIWAVS